MAFKGPVSFIRPEGGKINWNTSNVILPFDLASSASWLSTVALNDSIALRAKAFAYDATTIDKYHETHIYYDRDNFQPSQDLKCVIIGTEKASVSRESKLHYVLIVRPLSSEAGLGHERVGAGTLLGSSIKNGQIAYDVAIQ
jgi:hypothetical protein